LSDFPPPEVGYLARVQGAETREQVSKVLTDAARDERIGADAIGRIETAAQERLAALVFPAAPTAIAKAQEAARPLDVATRRIVSVEDAAKLYNVPPNFVLLFKDSEGNVRPYVTKEGLLAILKKHGFRAAQTRSEPDPDKRGGFVAVAEIYPDLRPEDRALLERISDMKDRETFLEAFRAFTRPTIAHATANDDNLLSPRQGKRMRELAETRALLRAIRVYTGTGAALPPNVDEDEVPDSGGKP
jgi:hypothetical protein